MPKRDIFASFPVAIHADNHLVAYKCTAGVAGKDAVDILCIHPDAE